MDFKQSVFPTWLLAVATATNVIVSVINPTVGAYIVKMIGTIRSTIRTAAKVLVPFLPTLGSL